MKTTALRLAALFLLLLASNAFAFDKAVQQQPNIVKQLSAKVEAWVATLPKEYLKN